MNDKVFISELRKLYKDILVGHTRDYRFDVYIKHFREIDIGFLNEIREQYKTEAIEKGLDTEEERIKTLIEQGVWNKEKEEEKKILRAQIANQYHTKSKLVIQAQIKQVLKRIDTLEEQLSVIESDRLKVLGLTAENYSDKISSEQVIRLAIFKDEKLSEKKYTKEEYDYLEPEELNELVEIYGRFTSKFTSKNIKRIAACSFFLNNLFLCKDDITRFFGKPIVELTNFQIDVFSFGLNNKSVIEKGNNPPATLQDDIDGLVEWYENSGNLSGEASKNADKSGSTLMGASKKEMD